VNKQTTNGHHFKALGHHNAVNTVFKANIPQHVDKLVKLVYKTCNFCTTTLLSPASPLWYGHAHYPSVTVLATPTTASRGTKPGCYIIIIGWGNKSTPHYSSSPDNETWKIVLDKYCSVSYSQNAVVVLSVLMLSGMYYHLYLAIYSYTRRYCI